MSVLVKDRHISQIDYVYNSWKLQVEIVTFLMKLSSKVNRVVGPKILELSADLVTLTVEASEIYRKRLNEEDYNKHYSKVVEAFAKANALDVQLNVAYLVSSKAPTGSFTKELSEKDATRKLDNAAETMGELMAKVMDELEEEINEAKETLEKQPWLKT